MNQESENFDEYVNLTKEIATLFTGHRADIVMQALIANVEMVAKSFTIDNDVSGAFSDMSKHFKNLSKEYKA